ncbi:hypothetical protein EUX98_g7311 [Antrodiella citrinella]|uniref:Uncharacterized protein n=1 Tax=Antrodiella citrinella TaxID=2447956 RepID=A0A4S4MNJ8_9APHY|nr:hypothetical protein EUX98_g7311 [Antrodiella citrinella]
MPSPTPPLSITWSQPKLPVTKPDPLKPLNDIALTPDFLPVVLSDLSLRIEKYFGNIGPVEIVIHGGAAMVLHKDITTRKQTFDVDYLHRAFEMHWKKHVGLCDAGARLRKCILETGDYFRLGRNWMNSVGDKSIAHAFDPTTGDTYDCMWDAAMSPENRKENTVYSSRRLTLIAVPWYWAAANKLDRFLPKDATDVADILELLMWQRRSKWTPLAIEKWLKENCLEMYYDRYPPERLQKLRSKITETMVVWEQLMHDRRKEAALQAQRRAYEETHPLGPPLGDPHPQAHPEAHPQSQPQAQPRARDLRDFPRAPQAYINGPQPFMPVYPQPYMQGHPQAYMQAFPQAYPRGYPMPPAQNAPQHMRVAPSRSK